MADLDAQISCSSVKLKLKLKPNSAQGDGSVPEMYSSSSHVLEYVKLDMPRPALSLGSLLIKATANCSWHNIEVKHQRAFLFFLLFYMP